MLRVHPVVRKAQALKTRILEVDIPDARRKGVDHILLQRCTRTLQFMSYPNPYKFARESQDRSLAVERVRKALREVKTIYQRIQAAVVEITPPDPHEEDAERFLTIAREQRAVLAEPLGSPAKRLRDRLVSRNAALGALDITIGTSTGYHAKAFMEAQTEAGKTRLVVKSAVAFSQHKDRLVSMEDGRIVPYKLQRGAIERGDLARRQASESETAEPDNFSREYSDWLARMLADDESN